MVPEEYASIFERFAIERHATSHADWDDTSCPIRKSAMLGFVDLVLNSDRMKNPNTGQELKIVPGILVSDEPNAFATFYEGYMVVGLTTALEKSIERLAVSTIEKPFVLRARNWRYRHITAHLEKCFPMIFDEYVDKLQPEPLDQRGQTLWMVIFAMYQFVLCHELAHCMKGHVDYLTAKSESSHAYLDELHLSKRLVGSNWGLSNGERQILEFDADYCALSICLAAFAFQPQDFPDGSDDEMFHFEKTLFGIYAMMWLLSTLEAKDEAEDERLYPAAIRRLRVLYGGAKVLLANDGLDFFGSNHYAFTQLKIIENRIESGWLDQSNEAGQLFSKEDRASVAEKMAPHMYRPI